jgi:site-specific DNA-cytosine methylase
MDLDRSSDGEEEVDDAVAPTVDEPDETDECAYPDEPEPDEDVKHEDDGAPASSRGSCKPAPAKRRRTVTKSSGFQFSFLTLKRQAWPEAKVAIVDLFCCIGGYSTGAVQAGHSIALAVDNDPVALAVHEANHPETKHVVMELGPDTEETLVALIRETVGDRPFHLHGSPPCTKLSCMQGVFKGHRSAADVREGMRLVHWYFDLVRRLNPVSWTFEQVAFTAIMEELDKLKRSNPSFFDYMKVQMADFGVPQTRTRLIGGIPHMIDRIRHLPSLRVTTHVGIAEVLTPPPHTVYIRDSSCGRKTDDTLTVQLPDGTFSNPEAQKGLRPLSEPVYTVMSSCSHTWVDLQFRTVRKINGPEALAMQTFPTDYKFPCKRVDQIKGIGNAIPCLFARKLMSDYRMPPGRATASTTAAAAAASRDPTA